jgi:uncharacterized protein (TIGR03437 family)
MRLVLSLCVTVTLVAQVAANRAVLNGHVDRRATAANDRGRADSSLQLNHVMVILKPSAAQQADLEQFLAQQQDPSSPNFHKWLTPEQYADRFGTSQADINSITSWLTASGLSVDSVARGRNEISFSGNVRKVESAFATEIHRYNVNGESHFANATDPSVPAALAGHILSVHGLTDFRMKSRIKSYKALPKYTAGTASGVHYLAPGDIAELYDIKPLQNAGITGAGQKIAVVGQTNINMSDIASFRTYFNLPANNPTLVLVPGSPDPGISSGDLAEADLDIEFAGAVAPDSSVLFIYSNDVVASAQWAIDQNYAPVLTMSYGDCESEVQLPAPPNFLNQNEDLATLRTFAQQASTQGITWMAASGDNGAADCYADNLPRNAGAALAVDAPGSIPEVTSVGGTELNEANGTYFANSNDPNHASLYSYVPEMVWNDSAIKGTPAASGGGVSSYFTKPSWQTGPGVPNDGYRDVPDVSFASSPDHDGLLFYSGGSLGVVGGTSVAAPTFAGIMALLNQYQVVNSLQSTSGQGSVNPRLYAMAQSVPGAFHDITVGNNIVNGCGTRACTTGSVGYNAGPGYDLATGLGSLDVFNFVIGWHQTSTTAKSTPTVTLTQLAAPNAQSFAFTATVSSSNGGTPTGTVNLISGGATVGTGTLTASGSGQSSTTITVAISKLPAGVGSLSGEYSGDSSYGAAAASIDITVASSTSMFITGITNGASFRQAYSPGEILAVFGNLLAGSTLSASSVPLPTTLGGASVTVNGTAAPLYFVSPGQINLQIPYGLVANTVATLVVTYNGQTATTSFPVSAASPGIFVDSNGAPAGAATAARGQTVAIYVTGPGPLSPQPAAGSYPASGTVPTTKNVVVSVAGINASASYVGTPVWAIGLIQINFTVPSNTPLGQQELVVTTSVPISATISSTAISAPATITITQ